MHLQLLIHHVADADSGDDFEEVGRQAPVESRRALGLQDLPEETAHFQLLLLLLSFCSSCQSRERTAEFQTTTRTYKCVPGEQKSYLVLACGCGPEPEDNWRAAHMCWTQCHRRAGRARRGQRHWCCSCGGSSFSVSDGGGDRSRTFKLVKDHQAPALNNVNKAAHLIHCQVDAGVGDDSQHVGDVALIKSTKAFSPEYLLGAV